jgi:ferrous iron transport protein B
MLVMVLLVPCVNTIIVLFKEQRIRAGMAILGTVFVYALLVGGLVNHACRALGVTFG